jgi:hypothetical protein
MTYRGDIRLGDTIDVKFTTRRFSSGAPFTLAGTPAVSAYVGNSTTEITAGITLTVDFDSRTGLNNVRVVASSGNGFAAGDNVALVITAGTVDSVSVVGEVIGAFSIEARSALMPTTAGNKLDVTATGAAGIDLGNVENQSTTLTLSGTTIAAVSGAVGSVTGAVASVTGNVGGTVNGLTATAQGHVRDAVGLATANLDSQLDALPTAAENTSAVWAAGTRVLTAGTNIVLAKGTGVTGFNDLSAAQVNAEVDTAIADARLDELLAADSDIDGAAPPAVGSVFHELMTKTAGSFTYDQTTDSLEAIRDRGDAAWLTATGFSTLDAAGVRAAVGLATANLDTQLGDIATDADAAKTAAEAAKVTTDKLDDTLEDDGGTYRFTTNALEQAPAGGGGGGTDWTADERTAIRTVLGIPGSGTTPTDPSDGILDDIRDAIGALPVPLTAAGTRTALGLATANLDSQLDALPTAAENTSAVWAAGTRTLTSGANIALAKGTGVTGFNDLDAAGVRSAVGLASANLDTQLGGLPTAAENAGAVWDEPIAGHLGAGSTGNSLNGATAAGNPWEAIIEGSYTAEDILRVLAAVAAGKTTIVPGSGETAAVTFRDISDASDLVEASMDGSERVAMSINP